MEICYASTLVLVMAKSYSIHFLRRARNTAKKAGLFHVLLFSALHAAAFFSPFPVFSGGITVESGNQLQMNPGRCSQHFCSIGGRSCPFSCDPESVFGILAASALTECGIIFTYDDNATSTKNDFRFSIAFFIGEKRVHSVVCRTLQLSHSYGPFLF